VAHSAIALATEDFAVYLDLSQQLQAQDISFESLTPGSEVPGDVEVVITTADERSKIGHEQVVIYSTPEDTIEETIRYLRGLEDVRRLVIGVDPGERPGLAVIADGHVVSTRSTSEPETVVDAVERIARRYPDADIVVRVGNGAQTRRDRIVNTVLESGFDVELVDETASSPPRQREAGKRDKVAARVIAMTVGEPIQHRRKIEVPPGEIRDIQRRSRKASDGKVTISRTLAGKVAQGNLSLAEAVRRQCHEQVQT
jgi:hypothetical protein